MWIYEHEKIIIIISSNHHVALHKHTTHLLVQCICAIKKLRYMDRPVFGDERATAEAWEKGGYELEQKVRKELQEKSRNKDKQSLQDFRDWQKEVRRKRQEEIDSGVISEERLKEVSQVRELKLSQN